MQPHGVGAQRGRPRRVAFACEYPTLKTAPCCTGFLQTPLRAGGRGHRVKVPALTTSAGGRRRAVSLSHPLTFHIQDACVSVGDHAAPGTACEPSWLSRDPSVRRATPASPDYVVREGRLTNVRLTRAPTSEVKAGTRGHNGTSDLFPGARTRARVQVTTAQHLIARTIRPSAATVTRIVKLSPKGAAMLRGLRAASVRATSPPLAPPSSSPLPQPPLSIPASHEDGTRTARLNLRPGRK